MTSQWVEELMDTMQQMGLASNTNPFQQENDEEAAAVPAGTSSPDDLTSLNGAAMNETQVASLSNDDPLLQQEVPQTGLPMNDAVIPSGTMVPSGTNEPAADVATMDQINDSINARSSQSAELLGGTNSALGNLNGLEGAAMANSGATDDGASMANSAMSGNSASMLNGNSAAAAMNGASSNSAVSGNGMNGNMSVNMNGNMASVNSADLPTVLNANDVLNIAATPQNGFAANSALSNKFGARASSQRRGGSVVPTVGIKPK